MREWKYRFKRGLASFLTVGMIASGVSGTTCLPVYAVEASSVNQEDVNDGVRQITAGLKKQIVEMFAESSKREQAEFEITVQLTKGSPSENTELLKNIKGNANKILEQLLKENPSELFWYDTSGKVGDNNLPYSCDWEKDRFSVDKKFKATCVFQLAVKEDYKGEAWEKNHISIDIEKVKQKKAAVDKTPELEKASAEVYDQIKKKIIALDVAQVNQAEFTVSFPVSNEEEYKILKGLIEARAEKIVPSLLADKDCSSELFWYDGSSIADEEKKTSYKWGVWTSDNQQTSFTLKLAVKPEYRMVNSTNAISLDVEKIKKIKNTVDLGEGQEWKDYFILKEYKDQICFEAGGGEVDPFTGSNRFQYLCNKTTEFQLNTECHTVSGTRTKEGSEPEPYTWNIVGIESKKENANVQKNYYLVDIAECKNNSAEYFMVGAQGTQGEYTTANGTTYVPDGKSELFTISNLKYKQDQDGFRFVLPDDISEVNLISRELGGEDIIVSVEGNVYSNISFSSTNQDVATISRDPELKNRAQIHMLGAGLTVIWATAYETDSHAWRSICFTLSVHEKENNDPQEPVVQPENPGGTGGNTGGSGSSGDIGGIGGGTGGSGGTGSVTTTVSSGPGELLPQIDFCLNSGTATILKSVGAEDFTITASGQVKDSTVTYASSDPSVATVDANTGTVHIVGSGTAVISATASKTTLHREEKCEYKLEVR